jgi:hypothetical protein
MARIPESELDRLKHEVSLVRLVEASGIELKKHGKDYLGLCPFHDDKEPSLVISPNKNLWKPRVTGSCRVTVEARGHHLADSCQQAKSPCNNKYPQPQHMGQPMWLDDYQV